MTEPLEKKIEFEEAKPTLKQKLVGLKKKLFRKPTGKKKYVLIGLGGIFLALLIFLPLFVFLPLLNLRSDIDDLTIEGKQIYIAVQAQDLNQAIAKIESTNGALNKLAGDYKKLIWLKFIPYFGNFYRDGEHLIAGGSYLLEAADIAVKSLQPYADILGLEGEEKKAPEEMTAEERLLLALDTLDKIQPNLDQIGEKLKLAQEEIGKINPNRYPVKIGKIKIREKVATLVETIDGTATAAIEIKPIVGLLKPLLGFPEEKKYFLLFQNDAELRPTGGFMTAYALLSINKGKITPGYSHDIYTLDARFGNRVEAPEPIEKYLPKVYYWHLRDMNLSPDFGQSMELFWENASKVLATSEVDGIIAVDTAVLVDIMEVLGPIGVSGWGNFSAETDERCNCPQVFYELELYADKPVGEIKTERKGIIGPLMHSILLNVMGSPRKKWPQFFNVAFSNIQEKHILFHFFDQEIQKALEVLNAAGQIKDYEGDYLHINDCNFASAKSNMYVEEDVLQEIEVASDGTVTKTLTIDYKNPEPPSDCNIERGELCLNGLYRDWLRIYVPAGSELIEAKGSEVEVTTYEELGKTVFEAFYGNDSPLRPLGKAQMSFQYKLPFKVEKGQAYKLLIQKQPGAKTHDYMVKVNGQEESFELSGDRELQFNL